jgi:hypothetical protein
MRRECDAGQIRIGARQADITGEPGSGSPVLIEGYHANSAARVSGS